MKLAKFSVFGLAAAFSESFSSLPSSYYTADGSMIWWKFDSSQIEYYLDSVASLQPGESFHEMWYWANNDKVRDGADVANYPRLEALMHGISDSKLIADSIDGWEGFPSCDGPDCGPVVEDEEEEEEEYEEEDEDEDEEMDMETMMKVYCTSINYAILSADNPTDYPAFPDSPFTGDSEFVQEGANCNAGVMTVNDCDCSDAENYSFADQDVCATFEEDEEGTHIGGDIKLISLVCGGSAVSAECTSAQANLEAEENFLLKAGLIIECEAACAEFPNETCGFLVNGVSMILFAMLAMLKY